MGEKGIVISSVPIKLRPIASGIAFVVYNIFGYGLSLVLSGSQRKAMSLFFTSPNKS